jgi:hypothetical protein
MSSVTLVTPSDGDPAEPYGHRVRGHLRYASPPRRATLMGMRSGWLLLKTPR